MHPLAPSVTPPAHDGNSICLKCYKIGKGGSTTRKTQVPKEGPCDKCKKDYSSRGWTLREVEGEMKTLCANCRCSRKRVQP